MRVVLFQDRFAEKVRAGRKLQTVRRTPKRQVRVGDVLCRRRWTGFAYGSKQETLGTAVCERVRKVRIDPVNGWLEVDGVAQNLFERNRFAKADGFRDFAAMVGWLRETHGDGVFEGVCWEWMTVVPPTA
ncbi:MAG: hypothetical protein AAF555_05710 [Verrucomicrobiota bacterium]